MSVQKRKQRQGIVIYKDARGDVQLRADVQKETIWATQAQIAELFGVDRTVVTKHVRNVFKDKELDPKSVCANFAHTADDGKIYQVQFYNLDIILAVGYRANSVRAIQFRQWATKILRNYIMKGYVLNAKRLQESRQTSVKELEKTLHFIQDTIKRRQLDQKEIDSLLSVINDYANAWILLHKYDKGLVVQRGKKKEKQPLTYDVARPAIDQLRLVLIAKGQAGELFGNERDGSFRGVLATIYQRFSGKELYVSLEEKAAHLLYFIIKDHVFSDGNKRIGSFLFILFLQRNGILYRKNGEKKISENALVALALLIAESNPREKENVIALITNLII
ncbi:virulence protein RhuM/Fic/DOC family protein [Candidatus Uhrbacteria bacterium]|nr:virulence protein RhuM/Fic/DOC family protein [Candidatus Uhrbacteria bacterium]